MSVVVQQGVDGDFVRPAPLEVAAGWMFGTMPATRRPRVPSKGGPRVKAWAALETAVLPALRSGRCFVTFSGGRDSSAVLAIATNVARRHGLPDPVPVTEHYPDLPETDEAAWQQAVIDHLTLREWIRRDASASSDLLGESAVAGLRRRGLVWPAVLHGKDPLYEQLRGGHVLTGEGGDEVFGRHRIWPLRRVALGPDRGGLDGLRWAASTLRPRSRRARRLVETERRRGDLDWLRPEARDEHHRQLARLTADEPLSWREATWRLQFVRPAVLALRHQRLIAAEHDVRCQDPLMDASFLAAFAASGPGFGYSTRTSAMSALFGDLLPPAVLARTSKAQFNRAYFGERARDFAQQWDGAGVDSGLVDSERLRAHWLCEQPDIASFTLLHVAWLAAQKPTQKSTQKPAQNGEGQR